jgi:hypothetical protein
MPELLHDPPIPRKLPLGEPFVQRIALVSRGTTIGQAWWHEAGRDGVVQLVQLEVAASHRRRNSGTLLLHEVISQASSICKTRGQPLRRIWMAVEQKSQVGGRAFLSDRGFHHVATIGEVLRGQDVLIYVRSFD